MPRLRGVKRRRRGRGSSGYVPWCGYDGVVRPRSTLLVSAVACLAALYSRPAAAAPIVFGRDVPSDGPDHFFVEFDVPEGTQEIEVKHDDLSEANILDFGMLDPN